MGLRPFVDLPVVQWCEPAEFTYHGIALAYDGGRYIYWLRGGGVPWFRRYDVLGDTHQGLPPAPWSAAQGSMLELDPSRNRLWAIQGNGGTGFAYYDLAIQAWTSVASLPAGSYFGSWIAHTCPSLRPGANDDHVYYAPANGSTALYRYSVSANAFTALASAPAGLGSGSCGVWAYNYDPDKIYVFRGGGYSDIYVYSISGNSWATLAYRPAAIGFSSGAHAVYDPEDNMIYVCPGEGTRSILRLNLATNELETFSRVPIAFYRDARRLALVKRGGAKFLYAFRGGDLVPYAVWRMPIYF